MKSIFSILIFVIVLLSSCGNPKTVETEGGVKLSFSGVGEASIENINNRLTSVFPDISIQTQNGGFIIESPKLIPTKIIKKMVTGNGMVQLKPSSGKSLILNDKNLKGVRIETSSIGNSQVMLNMNASAAKKWYQMTQQNIGQVIEVFVDEELIVAPTVNSEITGGITSVFGKNEMETKMLYSVIKFPSVEKSNIKITKREIYIKDGNGVVQKVPENLINKYDKNRMALQENQSGINTYLQSIVVIDEKTKSKLGREIQRIIDSEFETYLSETQLNFDQCTDVLANVEKVVSAYNISLQNVN